MRWILVILIVFIPMLVFADPTGEAFIELIRIGVLSLVLFIFFLVIVSQLLKKHLNKKYLKPKVYGLVMMANLIFIVGAQMKPFLLTISIILFFSNFFLILLLTVSKRKP